MKAYEIAVPGSTNGVIVCPEAAEQKMIFKASGHRNPDWIPPSVFVNQGNGKDFVSMGCTWYLACKERTLEFLQPILKDAVEVLPMKGENETFFLLNVLTSIDCLDREKSKFFFSPSDRKMIIAITKFEWDVSKMDGLSLFFLPYPSENGRIFCTDKFREIVEGNNLTGLMFRDGFEPPSI
jgi:hypothetical protein